MMTKTKRFFNTSGPNRPQQHYTLKRETLIREGIDLVEAERYFTIWAPRQTGKSTYFRLLADKLEKIGYKVTHVNLENFKNAPLATLFEYLLREIKKGWNLQLQCDNFGGLYNKISNQNNDKCILIVDEIEGLNPDYFGQFLHTIRNLYHSRNSHILKSVILVGVSNIVGVISDNASPFNVADNLDVPYFSTEEVFQLLAQHEQETGQLFHPDVKEKICRITANQPGLVNGFANRLVSKWPEEKIIQLHQYHEVEKWYLKEAIDKNVANVINKAHQYRTFVESLLFTETRVQYDIERPAIKFLHTHGIVDKDPEGFVRFWVPLYRKKLYSAFYPYSNGESKLFFRNVNFQTLYHRDGRLNFDNLLNNYKTYVKKRSFKYFREKDETTGKYKNIKEAALAYSFETYIQAFLQEVEGKSYLEAHTGLGRSDLIIYLEGREYVVEFKIYQSQLRFRKGKGQLAYYCKSIGCDEGIYIVFVPNTVTLPEIMEGDESVDGVKIKTYIVDYDEEKDF